MKEEEKRSEGSCNCPYCDEETALCADLPQACVPCEVVIVTCGSCGAPVREGAERVYSCGGKP